METAKGLADHARHFRGARSGSAGKVKDWIGRGFAAQAGEDDNFQSELAARARTPVFPDLELSAVGVVGAFRGRAGLEAIERRRRRPETGTRRRGQQENHEDRVPGSEAPHGVEF